MLHQLPQTQADLQVAVANNALLRPKVGYRFMNLPGLIQWPQDYFDLGKMFLISGGSRSREFLRIGRGRGEFSRRCILLVRSFILCFRDKELAYRFFGLPRKGIPKWLHMHWKILRRLPRNAS